MLTPLSIHLRVTGFCVHWPLSERDDVPCQRYTNDLFAVVSDSDVSSPMRGVPIMQARFGEFNLGRRATTRSHDAMKELLGLPEEEEHLHTFRCSHADRTGHLVLTPGHLAFLA